MGSPAAHSLHGDESGKVLVGTVCNEIYEVDFDSADEAPMCYRGHYDELWGLAEHPLKQEFVTTSNDATLRVWDVSTRTQKYMAKLQGPGRCCAYSPDGKFIAVGLGSGGKASGRPLPHEGKWLILDEELNQVESPPQVRKQRVADIVLARRHADRRRLRRQLHRHLRLPGGRAERLRVQGTVVHHPPRPVGRLDGADVAAARTSCCTGDGGRRVQAAPGEDGSKMKDAEWATSSHLRLGCAASGRGLGRHRRQRDGALHGAKSYAADAPAGPSPPPTTLAR